MSADLHDENCDDGWEFMCPDCRESLAASDREDRRDIQKDDVGWDDD